MIMTDDRSAAASTGHAPATHAAIPVPDSGEKSDSLTTVLVAFAANLVIAVAKTIAAILTGSSSMLAEAAHSWADAGNEVFLLIADKRSKIPADDAHPLGHGREAYVWSMFAALGLFAAGAAVSVTHGVSELFHQTPADDFTIGYVVLAVAFVLEGISFLQSARQARAEAETSRRDLLQHVLATSDPTLRAVFAEDSAALIGLVIAALGLGLHQLTGSAVPDAIASVLIGLLLGIVALVLINRNRRFLVGEVADPRIRAATLAALLALPEISSVTYLRLEIVGPRQVSLIADVDLSGDDRESLLAVRLRQLEDQLTRNTAVVGAVLSLSAPGRSPLS